MADDRHDERRDVVHFTPDQERKLLNLLDVAEDLEKFSEKDKEALALLIADAPELHAVASGREFTRRVTSKLKWLGVQIAAAVAFFAGASELYYKLKGHP